ncbi:MAG: hypothetical protein EPN82_05115 [Bacteroidetes bacterium]|nr:MAG: hypothetical protein EPN82_05115 [Bacteroidota bacterium]
MKNITFFLLLALLSSCFKVPEQLVMPGWDTELNLPLTNRTYTLAEIIKSDKYVRVDTIEGKDVFLISSDSMYYSFGIGEYLKNKLDQGFTDIELNLQNGEATIEVELTNGVELDSALFSGGELVLDIINTGSSVIEFEVTLPDLYKNDGKNFKIKSSVPGNGRSTSNLDLTGCYYSSEQVSDKRKLRIRGKILSGSGTNLVKLNVRIQNSDFKYISGKIPSMDLTQIHDSFEMPITTTLEKFRDKFTLNNTVLTIEAEYKTQLKNPFEIQVKNIEVMGRINDGTVKYLEENNGNRNLGGLLITKNKINRKFNNSNSNIADFLSFLPDSIIINADVTVNPQDKRGEASSSDSVMLFLKFELTGEMSFNNIPYSDSVRLDFDEENRKAIRNGREAILYIEVTNAIPLTVDFDIVFEDSTGNALFNKKTLVRASEVDNFGISSIPSENFSQIIIDSTEIQKFADCEKVVYNLILSTSDNGRKVSIEPENWIKLLTYFKLKYHLKFE